MDEIEYAALTVKLSPSKRSVYDAIRDHGPITDEGICDVTGVAGRTVRPRRAELAKMGLVRRSTTAKPEGNRRVGIWELTPVEEIDATRETAQAAGPRRRAASGWPVEDKVKAFLALARDEETQAAVAVSQARGARRARARLSDVLRQDERERRERMTELREAEQAASTLVDFLKARNALKRQQEIVHATSVFLQEEIERQQMLGESAIPADFWNIIPDLLVEVVETCDAAYEKIARYTGHPSRCEADYEIDEEDVIDGELIMQLVAGEDVTRDS
jgi:hypothetical protein